MMRLYYILLDMDDPIMHYLQPSWSFEALASLVIYVSIFNQLQGICFGGGIMSDSVVDEATI